MQRALTTSHFHRPLFCLAALAIVACAADPGEEVNSEPVVGALTGHVTISNPPTYMGTKDDAGGCNTTYNTTGYRPTASGSYPLFLYFVGTGDDYTSQAAQYVTQAFADRGYVALSVQYDNSATTLLQSNKDPMWSCLFGATGSLLSTVCAAGSSIDCSQGIVTWGHSLGGSTALSASHWDSRVRATWATGVNSLFESQLSPHKIRIVNGGADGNNKATDNNNAANLSQILGLNPSTDCPGQTDQCLRADGSGWIIVRHNELSPDRPADHCWFYKQSCLLWTLVDPNYESQNANIRISVGANANFIATAAH